MIRRSPLSEEHKKKISESKRGHLTSEETRRKIGLKSFGRIKSPETRKKLSQASTGKHLSEETKRKMSEKTRGRPNFGNRGDRNHFWKGGTTPLNAKIRTSLEYKIWRRAVFERDRYQCIWGGKSHGNKLQADHIKPFAYFPELRFSIDNGRTLCEDCHRKTFSYLKSQK